MDGDVVEAGLWFGPLRSDGVRRAALLLGRGATAVVSDVATGDGNVPVGSAAGSSSRTAR